MNRNLVRVVLTLFLVLGLNGSAIVAVAAQGGDGGVDIGGNDNTNNQDNDQGQDQDQTQDQDAAQDNSNGSDQDNANAGSAGGDVDNGCDASQDGDDGEADDTVECASGDASAGDSEVGDTNQANAGSQSGSNDVDQTGTQNGGNQANTPSNTTDQDVTADVDDIGGDDNDVDNSGSINDNSGDIDQSEDTGGIEGDGNDIGGGDALSAFLTQLLDLLALIIGGGLIPGPGVDPDLLAACEGIEDGDAVLTIIGIPVFVEAEVLTGDDLLDVCLGVGIDLGGITGDGLFIDLDL